MLVRKLINSKGPLSFIYNFGVDAKKLVIGVPKEVYENEKRVSITPDTIQRMIKKNGVQFAVEKGAGEQASISDQDYINSGAKIVSAKEAL
jgi:NAD/NADP transhydrogenase alpha subunit